MHVNNNHVMRAGDRPLFPAARKYLHSRRRAFISSCALFLSAFFLNLLARHTAWFGPWYNRTLYPLLPGSLGRLLSPLPFSLFEALICLFLLLASGFLLFCLGSLWSRTGRRRLRRAAGSTAPVALVVVCAMFLMQTLTCFINYSRMDFSTEIGLVTYPANAADLTTLCNLLISDLDELTSRPGGISFENVNAAAEAKNAMIKLGKKYPSLSGYYPNPKPIFFSRVMSTLNLTGIFSPYTTEANYNRDVTPYVIPYTICHELAHVKGFIKENEAGFIAYLACSDADSPQLRYSGALNALSYSLNALYRAVSMEEYQRVLRTVPQQALEELQTNQAYWRQFQKGVRGAISSAASAANDNYLKVNAQSDGSQSYGRMVDLLLSYYKIGAAQT